MPVLFTDEGKGKLLLLQSDRCGGCGYCVEVCPREYLALSKRLNERVTYPPEVVAGKSCTLCNLCAIICPDFAIYIADAPKAAEPKAVAAGGV